MTEYDQRPAHAESHFPAFRDALEPDLAATEGGPHEKLSISVPQPLMKIVRELAGEAGATVSGAVMQGSRLVVVVQSDRLSRSATVLVRPMTSRGGRRPETVPPYLAWVGRRESGLDRDAWVKPDQLVPRPVDALGPRLGRLAPEAMARVDSSLRFVLAL